MVLLCPSAFLCFCALFSMLSVTAERTLFCSSENIDIWYTFDGKWNIKYFLYAQFIHTDIYIYIYIYIYQ